MEVDGAATLRVQVLNQLLSVLWHLDPPLRTIASLQNKILEFFWSSLHWISAGVLLLPPGGGQPWLGLHPQPGPCLPALKRLLFSAGSPEHSILAHAFFHHVQGFQYDWQLKSPPERSSPNCQSFSRTWKLVSATRSTAATQREDLLTEPLLHNPHLCMQMVESSLVCQRMVLADVRWTLRHSTSAWGYLPCASPVTLQGGVSQAMRKFTVRSSFY